MRLCPRHGPVDAYRRQCPGADCRLPLLRLDGRRPSGRRPGSGRAGQPAGGAGGAGGAAGEVAGVAAGERYRSEIAALAREGYCDAEIVAWFKPLGVALTAADVEAALCDSYLR